MNLLGPMKYGERFAAFTTWKVRWACEEVTVDDRVRAASPDVEVTIELTLPVLVTAVDATAATRWSLFVESLDDHERAHAAIGVAAGHATLEALTTAAPESSASSLRRSLRATTREVLIAHRAMDRRLDEQTDSTARSEHG